MPDKKKIIESFRDLLNKEICQCINQDVDLVELSNYEKIFILQSAPLNILEELINMICCVNKKTDFVILGQSICNNLNNTFSERGIYILAHDKPFETSDTEVIEKVIEQYNIDAILYFNDFVNSLDFSNIEQLMIAFEDTIPIYSYSYGQQELNRHIDVAYHLYGSILYKDLLEWFKTWK